MKKTSNQWHRSMYDSFFARETIGSKKWRERSKKEAQFLIDVLNVPRGTSWLDVPCGTGRHAIRLARAGYRVTGVDISGDCLVIAKRECRHPNLQFKQGDMSRLEKFQGRFDVVTNLFTSFGYFSTDQENKNVLKGMVKCLKPGGQLVINTINRDFLLPLYQPARWSDKGRITVIEASRFDPKTQYNEAQIVFIDKKTGQGRNYYHRVRLYSRAEVVALMEECGLQRVRVYGDFDGNTFMKTKSSHPIYIGER